MTETSASATSCLDARLLDGVEDAIVVTRDHGESPFDPNRIARTIEAALREPTAASPTAPLPVAVQHDVARVTHDVLARLPRIATVEGTIPAPAIRALVAGCLEDAGHAVAARRCREGAAP